MTSYPLMIASVVEDAIQRAAVDREKLNDSFGLPHVSVSQIILDPRFYLSIEISTFDQTWPSTALGFGGIGGQAFTSAPTTIVTIKDTYDPDAYSKAYVYFGGRFAYSAHPTNGDFIRDKLNQNMPSVANVDYNMEEVVR